MVVREFAAAHNGKHNPGIMERLLAMKKFDGPPDFAENLDQYMDADLHEDFDGSLMRSGVRGKHAKRYHEGTNLVLLAPDVAAAFPDAKAVNDTLRLLMTVAKQSASASKAATPA